MVGSYDEAPGGLGSSGQRRTSFGRALTKQEDDEHPFFYSLCQQFDRNLPRSLSPSASGKLCPFSDIAIASSVGTR
ncbi:hypothetical protein NL676_002226 [Syzygium grande]|nr:hypothetical protein NL676_002226 [Syzygium grande]